ncbi:MAG: hypothetical protein NTY39_02195 [Campylobacterales bacterium]|nr:hypothetical protein [Campylobacterales bacterium]
MRPLLYPLYLLLLIIILLPKEKLYYTFEQLLLEKNIVLTGETLDNRYLYLDVQNATVMMDTINIAAIENIRLTPWIFFNQLTLSQVTVSPLYRPFFPGAIETMTLTYSLWHPLSLQLHGEGDFGQCNGDVDLVDQKVRLVFDPTPELRRYPLLVFKLHTEKEGLVYETTF